MNTQSTGMRLLKHSQNGIVRMIFSRMGVILVLLALNVLLLLAAFGWFREFLPHFYGGTALFTIGMVLYVINSRMDPTSKITWLIVIMLLPVFGSLFYLFTCADIGHRAVRKKLQKIYTASKNETVQSNALNELTRQSPGAGAMARYVSNVTGIPVFSNTDATYFSSGEDMFQQLLNELKNAEKSIYLEYFIINEGVMWGQILEILTQKAAQGVDVRVIYDGTCEFVRLPKDYPKLLRSHGIACRVFAPVTPFLSTHYNYRDHRKILTIDSRVAFTGGVNLADEYINATHPYGYWKDTGIMLKGNVAASLERMFLQVWNLEEKELSFPPIIYDDVPPEDASGFVMPYYEDPLDDELIARQVYIDILNRAQRYVHIMTPYLILDGELESALTYAAKRGVDVILLLPAIPDQKTPHALAKGHYPALLEAGVKIYEYTPGFVHSKVVVSDDCEAVVGTINFDYRSLYHHFECAVYLYNVPCIADISRDFDQCITQSVEMTLQNIRSTKLFYKIAGPVLKTIAPLM